MDSIRNYINLFESADMDDDVENTDDEMMEECTDQELDEALGDDTLDDDDTVMDELDDGDDGLQGNIDPRALAKLLPEIDDVNRFVNGVRKVQKGDIASLNIAENRQLAKAFISLLRDNSDVTMKALQKLRMVHSKDETLS